ncbi:MAG: glycosyltransferase [Spirochaetaceae bacterium]
MRVLHIITRLANGGAGENTLYSVNGIDPEQYTVDLAVGENNEPAMVEKIRISERVTLRTVHGLRRDPSPLTELKALVEIRRIIRDGNYAIVHTHGAKAGILGRIAAKKEGVPIIINGIHGITFSEEMGRASRTIYRWMERWAARFTTHFVSVGHDIMQKYLDAGIGRSEDYTVIHSGMELRRFQKAGELPTEEIAAIRGELGIPAAATVVAKISRLEKRKGYHYFLRAAQKLCQSCSPQQSGVYFLIVGDGPELEPMRQYAGELGIGDRVIFTGYRTDVERMFAAADIVALTSLWEGLPRVLVQAAAVGRPIVTFNCDGAWEIVENGRTGFIVSMRDEEAVARQLDRLVADRGVREEMGRLGRAKVDESWSREAMVRSIEELYARLLAEAGLPHPRAGDPRSETALRIAMVTQEDPFYIPLFFREFFRIARIRRELASADAETRNRIPSSGRPIEVQGLMIQRPLGNKTSKGLAKRIWRLYGTLGFVRVGFRYVWAKLCGRFLRGRSVSGAAKTAGVSLLPMADANGEAFLSFVRENRIDLVVSVSASQIFKGEILSAPTYGCINLHNAPLPHYRGMLPNFWQMYQGEKESVLTIHQMVEDLDKGDILLQRTTPIREEMSLEQLIRTTKVRSARALWHLLDRFATDTVEVTPLPEEEGSYFSWPTREEAKEFRRRGRRLL